VGAQSRRLGARMRAVGFSTLEDLEAHYTGGDDPMSALNYVWYQYRWQRLAATMFDADGEEGLVRFWDCFRATDRFSSGDVTAASLAPLLRTEVSETLGRAVHDCDRQCASTASCRMAYDDRQSDAQRCTRTRAVRLSRPKASHFSLQYTLTSLLCRAWCTRTTAT